MNEFDIIEKYFAPLAPGGLTDDAAVLEISAGMELVVSSDTLSAGTHFVAGAGAADIAHKALRVNLSDLAAMGAEPLAYQLCIAFDEPPEPEWLAAFTDALRRDQEEFGIYCSGGDTTSTKGALSISITVMGVVPKGQAVTRGGAQAGDILFMSGPVGDAFIGLRILQGDMSSADEDYFVERYYRPRPRIDLAGAIREHVRAAIDVSDGMLADLGHICAASGAGAEVVLRDDLFSEQARRLIERGAVSAQDLLSGGDDYVLLLCVAPENVDGFLRAVPDAIQIGGFVVGEVRVILRGGDGQEVPIKHTGWSHF